MPIRVASLASAMLCLVTLAGCATSKAPQLATIDAAIPAGVTFDGLWRMRGGQDSPDADRSLQTQEGIVLPTQGRSSVRQKRAPKGPSVQLFLRYGDTLKISQTAYGLFISFDRSVVEEYRFREHRPVNVGPIEAERVSGWEAGGYVVRTIDEEGALLTEKYSLEDGGATLLRSVRIEYRDETRLATEQRFGRSE